MCERKTDDEILAEYVREKFPMVERSLDFRTYALKVRLGELGDAVTEECKRIAKECKRIAKVLVDTGRRQ